MYYNFLVIQTKYHVDVTYENSNISWVIYDNQNKPVSLTQSQLKKIERLAYKRKREIEFMKNPDFFNLDLDEYLSLLP